MFTGIVSDVGRIRSRTAAAGGEQLEIDCRLAAQGLAEGESIAVSGVCLTVEASDETRFRVSVTPETLRKSGLGSLSVGSQVNLERAVRPADRMGGHLVQGHVDGTGTIRSIRREGNSRVIRVAAAAEVLAHMVDRGSIAVDGVSLTITGVLADAFQVSLIPQTLDNTTLAQLAVGDEVNLEVDIISKYVARHLEAWRPGAAQQEPASWLAAGGKD